MKNRNKAPQRLSLRDRFEFFTDKSGGCWIWRGAKSVLGYGSTTYHGTHYMAHRLSYEFYKAPIPANHVIDHLCRNPSCVNPNHLDAVSHAENLRRGIFPNGLKTHCPKGHQYTTKNSYLKGKYGDWRECRICRSEAIRRWKKANHEKNLLSNREFARKKFKIKPENYRV